MESLALEVPECFKPFTHDGFLSVSGNAADQCPIKMLQHTSSSQSLILSSVLPIESGFTHAPLHYVYSV